MTDSAHPDRPSDSVDSDAESLGDLGDADRLAVSHRKSVAKVLTVDQGCSDNQYMTQTEGMSQEQYEYLTAHLNAEAQRLSSPQVQVTIIKAKRSAVTGEPIVLIGRSK